MILLTLCLYLIIVRRNINYKLRLNFLLVLLYYAFYLSNWLRFYILYEIVFIIIIFVIILIGYSFERLIASYFILFYSLLFSRPVIIIILIFNKNFFIKHWIFYSYFYCYLLVGSFIVKFPIFGFHYWLPVAHVEASTVGRIILAAILLKLGRVGLYYVIFLINFIVKLHWLALSIRLVILIILNLRDLKIIIAYSSVAHIRLVFYILRLGSQIGKIGALIIIFYHGFISPLLFWTVGLLAWWKTRSLLIVKSLTFSQLFVFLVFCMRILNIGFPPFIGFLAEILIFKSLILNLFILSILSLRILFSCYYNVYLFWVFNGVIGRTFKITFIRLDVYIFLTIRIILNF